MGATEVYNLELDAEKVPEEYADDNISFISKRHAEVGIVQIDQNKKEIGYISAAFLCLNRMLGAGVFSTGSTIFALSGSVGTSLILWAAGSLIAFSGLLVYMELGSAIPRNGGEKNYLEYIYRKPKFLVTAMYASYVFFFRVGSRQLYCRG